MTVNESPASSDLFQDDPVLGELWLDVADIVGDPTVAKDAIRCLVPRLWNLDWSTWERLSKELTTS